MAFTLYWKWVGCHSVTEREALIDCVNIFFSRYYEEFEINKKTGESNLTQIYLEVSSKLNNAFFIPFILRIEQTDYLMFSFLLFFLW